MKNLFSSLKNSKTLGLIILAVLVLVGLPITLFEVSHQQETRGRASFVQNWGHTDSCNLLQIDGQPDSCTTGIANYPNTVQIKSKAGTHKVHGYWLQYFCPKTSDLGDPTDGGTNPTACVKNPVSPTYEFNVTVSDLAQPVSVTSSPISPYKACGIYQTDFFIQDIDGNTNCHFGNYAGGNLANWVTLLAYYCNTSVECSAVTPTPTPTQEITPTPTVPITITPTSTPGPSVTPTDTPTVTVTPTDTPTPTNPGTPVQPGSPTCNSLTADRNTTGTAPFSLTFTGTATGSDSPINKAVFTFGDGQMQTLTQGGTLGTKNVSIPLSHTYQSLGSYTASVKFFDGNNLDTGSPSSCSLSISVVTPPPGGTLPPSHVTPTNPIPKTGPENLVGGVGLVGLAIVVLGGLFAFGL